jgi:hypothetical protein
LPCTGRSAGSNKNPGKVPGVWGRRSRGPSIIKNPQLARNAARQTPEKHTALKKHSPCYLKTLCHYENVIKFIDPDSKFNIAITILKRAGDIIIRKSINFLIIY